MDEVSSDWAFCENSLAIVSRTFAPAIAMLGNSDLRRAVTCAYLLCRIVDTIEDDPHLAIRDRDRMYASFLQCTHDQLDHITWTETIGELTGSEGEVALAQGMGRVLRVLAFLPVDLRKSCLRWVSEMCRGMVIYSHRPPDDHGLHTLMNLDDLYRYCYFVAGTVGHLLTELFEIAAREALDMSARRVMRANAEAFGIGLQLVNIIKDIASDRRRGWSFIPRGFISEDAFNPSAAPNIRREALLALAPVFERAHSCLDRGLVYVLAVPRTQRPIRSFLTLPLWMGVRTLRCADGNAAIFDEDQRVAISRREVETLLHSCVEHAGDDNAVRQIYGRLRSSQTAVGS